MQQMILIFTILGLLILFPILIGYYRDYKDNPDEFKIEMETLKKAGIKILILVVIYFGVNKISELFMN